MRGGISTLALVHAIRAGRRVHSRLRVPRPLGRTGCAV